MNDTDANYIEIDYQALQPETLDNLIAAFVLQEGTDYGASELSFEAKKWRLMKLLQIGKAKIVYDEALEECNIVASESLKLCKNSLSSPS